MKSMADDYLPYRKSRWLWIEVAIGVAMDCNQSLTVDRRRTIAEVSLVVDRRSFENLKLSLTKVQTLIDEAKMEHFTNNNVKLWFDRVKQLLYDGDDILDEYVTEILWVKLESDRKQQVCNSVSVTLSSSDSIFPWLKSSIDSVVKTTTDEIEDFSRKVLETKKYKRNVKEINEKLQGVAKVAFELGLGSTTRAGSSRPTVFGQRPSTSSLINKNKVFGGENERKIIDFLMKAETT